MRSPELATAALVDVSFGLVDQARDFATEAARETASRYGRRSNT
jgi:hypothetical protein